MEYEASASGDKSIREISNFILFPSKVYLPTFEGLNYQNMDKIASHMSCNGVLIFYLNPYCYKSLYYIVYLISRQFYTNN